MAIGPDCPDGIARQRRKHIACVDKANVLPSMAYFRAIFDEVAKEFPDVAAEHVYVDAAALFLVQKPQRFDVLVTENMFGDILSDLTAALVGGMGMAPSADIGDAHGVFQPCHGTAPDIYGKKIANPIGQIWAGAMMLDHGAYRAPATIQRERLQRPAVRCRLVAPVAPGREEKADDHRERAAEQHLPHRAVAVGAHDDQVGREPLLVVLEDERDLLRHRQAEIGAVLLEEEVELPRLVVCELLGPPLNRRQERLLLGGQLAQRPAAGRRSPWCRHPRR